MRQAGDKMYRRSELCITKYLFQFVQIVNIFISLANINLNFKQNNAFRESLHKI